MSAINYTPPQTIKAFLKDYRPSELFYDWIVGPVGSGKTTGIFFKLIYMAKLQKPGPDGVRRTRAVIVRKDLIKKCGGYVKNNVKKGVSMNGKQSFVIE